MNRMTVLLSSEDQSRNVDGAHWMIYPRQETGYPGVNCELEIKAMVTPGNALSGLSLEPRVT